MDVTADLLASLRALDTPTVCNALEVLAPERRTEGFNREPLVCPATHQGAVVGFARTARIRCRQPNDASEADRRALRMDYYRHVEQGDGPTISVIQDLEENERGLGAFWGEVQANIHRGLGGAGVITDGSVRDLGEIPDDFFMLAGSVMPSHVWADLVDFGGEVEVAGMRVAPGDLIHADRHGAVVVPGDVAAQVPEAAAAIVRREAVILAAARSPGFDTQALARAIGDADEIH